MSPVKVDRNGNSNVKIGFSEPHTGGKRNAMLASVKNADEIIVMSEGKIVERGRHDQLIELGGIYRKLYDMQSL